MSTHEECKPGMWQKWQEFVAASLPNFAKCPVYVEQTSVPEAKFEEVAKRVCSLGRRLFDPWGQTRDAEFGARVVKTSYGYVTRMWLEAEEEMAFVLKQEGRMLPPSVVEIGGGYGRLAVPLSVHCRRYVCVDPIPISTQVCREYCGRFANGRVEVPSLPDFLALKNRGDEYKFDLAINVHSWNECTTEQIEWWLTMLRELAVPYLFTVSHGQMCGRPETPYRSIDGTWKKLLEAEYDLVAEEALGLSDSPHAFWKRR